jgi:translation initiation factor 2B subunit (eIF-2B alpha/beta/delta family)
LSDVDIDLLRRGKPFGFIDEALQTEWTVHPFVWQLKGDGKRIKYDWEHTEYRFVRAEDLQNYDHVPQLEIGLQRASVSLEMERALIALRDDHNSGAQELTLKALDFLLKGVKEREFSSLKTSEEFWNELRWRVWHLAKNGRPSMGAAIQAELFKSLDQVSCCISEMNGINQVTLSAIRRWTEDALESRITATQHSLEDLATHFAQYIEHDFRTASDEYSSDCINILTLSASGTITRSLVKLAESMIGKGLGVNITVLESRPGFEGVAFVNSLLKSIREDATIKSRLKIRIVSDASVASNVADVHYFVFGGDKVVSNGNVSNKIGTLTSTVIVKSLNLACKVVALFTTNKVTGSRFDSGYLEVEYNDEAEVTRAWPTKFVEQLQQNQLYGYHVEVLNAYFEWVPAKYIDNCISEVGMLSREDILRLGNKSEALEIEFFSDL